MRAGVAHLRLTQLPLARVGLGYAVVALAALSLAAIHIRRPATVCLLRSVTGVPCPFCGGTTAAVDLGHGHIVGALGASPLAIVGFVVVPIRSGLTHARRLPTVSRAHALWAMGVLLMASELYELHRFRLFWA